MSSLISKLTRKNEKEKTNKLAKQLTKIVLGEEKENFTYESRISKINENLEEINPKCLKEENLQYINETIDILNYNSKKGYLSQITKFQSRNLFEKDINITLERLKKLRKNKKSKKDVKANIKIIKDSLENKIQGKKRYSSRFIFIENSLQKLNFLKKGEISQEDFDEIAYCKRSLEKNKYLEKKYPEKQNLLIKKFENLLERRYEKKKNSSKKEIIKYAAIGTALIGSAIAMSQYEEKSENKEIKIKNKTYQKDTSYLKKKDSSKFQAYLVAENPKKDSIYKSRYIKYRKLFEKYSKINTPKGYSEKEFRAILASVARIETSMGNSNKAGRNNNEQGEKWLMGYTDGSNYPEEYAGTEKQIKLASKKIKDALEGKDNKYPRVNEYETKKEKEKYVLSVYNSGKDFKNNPKGKEYINKTHPFKKSWINYFNRK